MILHLYEEMNQMVNNNKNKNWSNSLVFGRWPQTKTAIFWKTSRMINFRSPEWIKERENLLQHLERQVRKSQQPLARGRRRCRRRRRLLFGRCRHRRFLLRCGVGFQRRRRLFWRRLNGADPEALHGRAVEQCVLLVVRKHPARTESGRAVN